MSWRRPRNTVCGMAQAYVRRIARGVGIAAAAGTLLACGAAAGRADETVAGRPVTFATLDDGIVTANVYGSGPSAVVLVHGGRLDKESWQPQVPALVNAGLQVLAIDLRGRGGSGGGSAGEDSVHLDVLAAIRYLNAMGASSISLVGASFGGAAVGDAVAALPPGEIERVVLLANSAIDHPELLSGRKLFIVAGDDTSGAGVPRLPAIRDQYDRAPEPKELVILEGAAHAQFLFETDQGERLMRAILLFLTAE
jgi:alpha/beta superfamily hydrolase